jgi:hypothetical protein
VMKRDDLKVLVVTILIFAAVIGVCALFALVFLGGSVSSILRTPCRPEAHAPRPLLPRRRVRLAMASHRVRWGGLNVHATPG